MNVGHWALVIVGVLAIACVAALGIALRGVNAYRYYARTGIYNLTLPPIVGFAPSYSYTVGKPIPLLVHTTGPTTARFYRLGARKEPVGAEIKIQATTQPNTIDRRTGVNWQVSTELPTAGFRPGLYSIELRQDGAPDNSYAIAVILKPRATPAVAILASTNSWDAYNAFGGFSNYENRYINRKLLRALKTFKQFPPDMFHLPRRRPNDTISQDLLRISKPFSEYTDRFVENEWQLISFVERAGYDYAVYSDSDMAFTDEPTSARLLIVNGHAEYWTPEMFIRFQEYLDRGGKVVVSGGNPLFRSGVFTKHGLLIHTEDMPPEYVNRLIGTYYDALGRGSSAPFAITKPEHWVFTGLKGERQIGVTGTYVMKRGKGQSGGGSGIFTQKIGIGSEQFELLAVGLNEWGPAHMVHRDTDAGGWVFNASSASFFACLNTDPPTARLLRNLLDDATGKRPLRGRRGRPTSELAGAASWTDQSSSNEPS